MDHKVFEFTVELRIEAPPSVVYAFFTEPELIERWLAVDARFEPVVNGVCCFNITGEATSNGRVLEADEGHRLVFTWGLREPETSTVEVVFEPDGRGTRLRLRHYGIATVSDHDGLARGWDHYLARLSMAAVGQDPGPDPNLSPRGHEISAKKRSAHG